MAGGWLAATTQRIARHLGVSCPSVTNMIKRLHSRQLVSYEPYHGVRLTDDGRRIAAAATRRRLLIGRYLVEKLGYTRDAARMEAARLEGAVIGAMEASHRSGLKRSADRRFRNARVALIFGTEDA